MNHHLANKLDSIEKTEFDFVVRCPKCTQAMRLNVNYLGHPVQCLGCDSSFVAQDKELESAALDEEVSELAKLMEWSGESLQFEPRPR